jgi:hypothetical protein
MVRIVLTAIAITLLFPLPLKVAEVANNTAAMDLVLAAI